MSFYFFSYLIAYQSYIQTSYNYPLDLSIVFFSYFFHLHLNLCTRAAKSLNSVVLLPVISTTSVISSFTLNHLVFRSYLIRHSAFIHFLYICSYNNYVSFISAVTYYMKTFTFSTNV